LKSPNCTSGACSLPAVKLFKIGAYFDMDEEGFIDLLLASGHPSVAGITIEKLKQGAVIANEPQVAGCEEQFSTASSPRRWPRP
jgi:hypothetical protein